MVEQFMDTVQGTKSEKKHKPKLYNDQQDSKDPDQVVMLISCHQSLLITKTNKPVLGSSKQYSKCYNIKCNFKPHSLQDCQIFITPYLFLCILNNIVLSIGGTIVTIFI